MTRAAAIVSCALIASCGFVLGGTVAAAEDTVRRGWHGEELPAGLDKAPTEGRYRWERDGAEMVYVPPGPFPMGTPDDGAEGYRDERPVHTVWLSGFYIDVHETRWAQWQRAGMPWSERVGDRRVRPAAPEWGIRPDDPVLDVTWSDARAYLRKVGKRLPTEAEWEKAARGTDGRRYPWGDEPPEPDVHAVWKDTPIAQESVAPVTCCTAGASPYGVLNMAGNVYEWVHDVYERDFYARSPRCDPACVEPLCDEGDAKNAADVQRVLRGGAYVLEIEDLRSALRWRLHARDRAPYIGFRGVVSGVGGPECPPAGASEAP